MESRIRRTAPRWPRRPPGPAARCSSRRDGRHRRSVGAGLALSARGVDRPRQRRRVPARRAASRSGSQVVRRRLPARLRDRLRGLRPRAVPSRRAARGFVEGRRTLQPARGVEDVELVVEGPVGEGYIVAHRLPRSRSPTAVVPAPVRPAGRGAGLLRAPDEKATRTRTSPRTAASSAIRSSRWSASAAGSSTDPDDRETFATAYTSYYVHEPVRYPRYLCYDCHRPGQWAWWDGFDPYYTTCSVVRLPRQLGLVLGPELLVRLRALLLLRLPPRLPAALPAVRRHRGRLVLVVGRLGALEPLWGGPLRRYKSPPPPATCRRASSTTRSAGRTATGSRCRRDSSPVLTARPSIPARAGRSAAALPVVPARSLPGMGRSLAAPGNERRRPARTPAG